MLRAEVLGRERKQELGLVGVLLRIAALWQGSSGEVRTCCLQCLSCGAISAAENSVLNDFR